MPNQQHAVIDNLRKGARKGIREIPPTFFRSSSHVFAVLFPFLFTQKNTKTPINTGVPRKKGDLSRTPYPLWKRGYVFSYSYSPPPVI